MMNIVIRSRRNSSEDEEKKIELMVSKLKKCGIPEHHCYKSLAATGFVDENLAAEWLVSHVDDPYLEDDEPRIFYLLLCPIDEFGSQVEEYWSACQLKLGWNEAHEIPPAVTLISDFPVSSRKIHSLHVACINILNSFAQRGELMHMVNVEMNYNEAHKYITGRLNRHTANILHPLVESLRQECLKFGVVIPAEKGPDDFKIVLANGDSKANFIYLSSLCRQWLQLSHACRWEARLYSKDVRMGPNWPVYRTRFAGCVDEDESCLVYSAGDYVTTDPKRAPPCSGWLHGFNVNSGLWGKFPINVCERVPHYHAWTLHKSFRLNSSIPGSPVSLNGEFMYSPSTPGSDQCVFANGNVFDPVGGVQPSTPLAIASPPLTTTAPSSGHTRKSSGSSSVFRRNSENTSSMRKSSDSALSIMAGLGGGAWNSSNPRRQVMVMRHGERVDFCFGKMWYSKSFDEKGVYKRLNLNMPAFLPSRLPADFAMDSPLTQLGLTLSNKTGHALMEGNFQISHCYCSPALRCVQTAEEVLRGACVANAVPIRIEPHLFEWLGWYQLCPPHFMTPKELHQHGFNVDIDYRPLSRFEDFDFKESVERFYERQYKMTKRLIESTKKKGGNILIVAHAGSLDACSRQLVTGKPTRKKTVEINRSISRIPYCATVCIEEKRCSGRWQFVEPCVLPFTHGLNRDFYWKDLINDDHAEVAADNSQAVPSPTTGNSGPSIGGPTPMWSGVRPVGTEDRYVSVSMMSDSHPRRWSAVSEQRDLGVGTSR